ncbi:CLUMA_CG017803, isoform A [Clunio marinus]|uniref:CLUMA_CG017803, isoform A n=1 Tax=Clunio marinus TaxID=568069 RepID=A0A1J1IX68_9DIPT|nr:CLUMA_CG017803, isoform A [Clunio marinus]
MELPVENRFKLTNSQVSFEITQNDRKQRNSLIWCIRNTKILSKQKQVVTLVTKLHNLASNPRKICLTKNFKFFHCFNSPSFGNLQNTQNSNFHLRIPFLFLIHLKDFKATSSAFVSTKVDHILSQTQTFQRHSPA